MLWILASQVAAFESTDYTDLFCRIANDIQLQFFEHPLSSEIPVHGSPSLQIGKATKAKPMDVRDFLP